MKESIRTKFFKGIAWTLVENVSVKVISIIITIVLARLLMPEDYGLIGMLSIFIAISEVFIQSGIGQALIQKSDCDDDDFSTAFYFNVAISIVIYFILFFAAPLIANFYHEPQLVAITRVLSLNFVLGSLTIVQLSKLKKVMNFKPLAIISLVSTVFSGVIGIVMAFSGYGVWALVAQTLSATLIKVIIFPLFTKWHPNRPFSRQSFKHLWNFGSKILVTGIIDVINSNLSNILIGRFYNKEQVGFFSKARNLADVPAMTMSTILGTVLYPLLSEIHNDEKKHIAVYSKVSRHTIILTFPILILLALLAKPIIIILFTDKWAESIPLFKALLLARLFLSLNVINANMLQSKGDTKLFMRLYFITGPISLLAIAIAIPLGVKAMAWATFFSGFINYSTFTAAIGKKTGYGYIKQLWDYRHIIISLVIMSFAVWGCIHTFDGLWTQLLVGLLVGSIVYLICCKFFHLVDEDIVSLIKTKLGFGHKH